MGWMTAVPFPIFALGLDKPLSQLAANVVPRRVNRPKREGAHALLSGAQINVCAGIPSIPNMSSCLYDIKRIIK
jgi:hypothetical protein